MKKIRKNDEVIVIAGKDKNATGTIDSVIRGRVVIEGVNVVKKHVKPNPNKGEAGGIVDKNMPLDISNVAILNPKTKKADRVGFRFDDKNEKIRFYKSSGEVID